MPKDSERREMTRQEMEQKEKEKFNTFFTTSVAQVPEEMINPTRAASQPDRKHGLLARFFGKKEKAGGLSPENEPEEELFWAETPIAPAPTGEIMLDSSAPAKEPPVVTPSLEELTLELEGADEKPVRAPEAPRPASKAEPARTPVQAAPAVKPAVSAPEEKREEAGSAAAKLAAELEKPPLSAAARAEARRAAARPAASAAPQTTVRAAAPAQPVKAAPAVKAAAQVKPAAKPVQTAVSAAPAQSAAPEAAPKAAAKPAAAAAQPEPVSAPPSSEREKLQWMLDGGKGIPTSRKKKVVQPEEDKEITQQVGGFHFFGVGEDEAPRGDAFGQGMEDTMSLELHEDSEEPASAGEQASAPEQAVKAKGRRKGKKARVEAAPAEHAAAHTAPEHAAAAETSAKEEPAPESAAEAEQPQTGEEAAQALDQTVAAMNLRCALSGILAAALIWAGFIYEGFLPGMAGLSPDTAPAAFMGANLLLLAAALAVSRNTMRDGLLGLVKAPSYDTMPALAGAAALLQSLVALLNPTAYQGTTLTLMSGAAALALFLNNLGSRLLAVSVRDGYKVATSGVAHEGAYRVQDKELIHSLDPAQEARDPWILLSRPMEGDGSFLAQSFGPHTGEKKIQTFSRVLLGCAAVGGVYMLLTGKGINGGAAAIASILCLGAPLSSTLIAGLTALRTERTAGAVGAVIPGWAGVEELNGIDTVQVDAGELFTPESAQLEDIRIFKGGRIDRAILYTASVLNQGCNTLSQLFRHIIADRTDILPPVKDLERHTSLGFSAWCENNRILIGTRAYMEQEGIALPEASYEAQHSRDGELQILYLAVSGNMYAMFVLRYIGGKHAARCLSILQKENIRVLVTCQDPSLTADKIAAAYHLPEGLITVLDEAQSSALTPAISPVSDAPSCMLHLKGFTSLTGGLRAAQRAQAAESAGVMIQLVSTGFSALIGLLLSYSGSVGTLSLLVVLMYQAAWSGLGIAVAAMKQHN